MVGMSEELKDALGVWAQSRCLSIAQVAREAIAERIDYDLDAEANRKVERRGRPKQYETKEQRRSASRQRAKDRRALNKRLLNDYVTQQARTERSAFKAAVEAKLGPVD
jgi:hypothetical protein